MHNFAHLRLSCKPSWMRTALTRAAAACLTSALLVSGCVPTPLQAFSPRPTATATPQATRAVSATPLAPTPTRGPGQAVQTPTATSIALQHLTKNSMHALQINFWYPWGGTDQSFVQALVSEFNAQNEWGIQVVATAQGSSSELARDIDAASSLPDVVAASPGQVFSWQAKPGIIDLNPYIYDSTWGITAGDLQDFSAQSLVQSQTGAEQLGFPARNSLLFLLYNATWANELGFSRPPTTPEEFRQQACAAEKAGQNASDVNRRGTGGWLVNSDALTTLGWVQAFGGSFAPDNSGKYHFNTPLVKDAFTYLDTLYSDGCAWIGRNPTPYDYFAGRYALFITASMEDLPGVASAMQRLANGDKWSVLAIPALNGKPLTVSFSSSYAVFQSTPARQLAAWLFIRWMTSPAQDSRLARGWGTYPVRTSSQAMLADYKNANPQWAAALPLLALAIHEPAQPSWLMAGAIVQDASTQLYTPETHPETIQTILGQMDNLAAEVIKP